MIISINIVHHCIHDYLYTAKNLMFFNQTKRFWIIIYIRESFLDEPVQSKFSIEDNRIATNLGTDIVDEVLLHNFTTPNMALKNGENF